MAVRCGEFFDAVETGDKVEFRATTSIFRGSYVCEVLAIDPVHSRLQITSPMVEGRVVIVPVGTAIALRIGSDGPWFEDFVVTERVGGDERYITVAHSSFGSDKSFAMVRKASSLRTIVVASGKGGVGKTTLAINLAACYKQAGQRVCILDGDLGTANVDVLMDVSSRYNLSHVLSGRCSLLDAMVATNSGVYILPGGSGVQELTELDDTQFIDIMTEFGRLAHYFDVLIVDTTSGLARAVTNFIRCAGECIVVTSPEPPAITDAYALIKVLSRTNEQLAVSLVVNRVESELEARRVAQKIVFAAKNFLGLDVTPLGGIPEDRIVRRCVMQQELLMDTYPDSDAASCIKSIWRQIAPSVREGANVTGPDFFSRFKGLLATK